MNILREHCPRLQSAGAADCNISTILKEILGAALALQGMMRNPAVKLATTVAHLRNTQLLLYDSSLERALGLGSRRC